MKKFNVRKCLAAGLIMMALFCVPLFSYAQEEDVDALKEQISTLESENADLQSQVEQLESENAALQEQLAGAETAEPETEALQTEIAGVEYTDKSIVQMVQQALNDAGYECGTADGVAGSKTVEAINAYEKEKGINVNGVITDELLDSLGIADAVAEAAENEAKMKEYSSEYSYTQLARDPDSYIGQKMTFSGKVLQTGDAGSGLRYVRLAANSDSNSVLFVTYEEDIVPYNILEDDIITIYGVSLGEYTYEAVLGNSITIPWINADIIDMSSVTM